MEAQRSGADDASGLLARMYSQTKSGLSSAWNAVTKDGTLAAAGRQGADELATALKAFPETIQAQTPGTILNPTQGEIAASRSTHGGVHGRGNGGDGVRSPSEIAKDNRPYRPEPDQGHDQERGRGR